MIDVSTIVKKVRFKARDNDEVKFSDYEILQALNEVIDYLNDSYALQNTDYLEKIKIYSGAAVDHIKGCALPSDFVALVSINDMQGRPMHPCPSGHLPEHNEYIITGDRLFTPCNEFKIVYRKHIESVDGVNDEVDLPPMFENVLKNGTYYMMVGTDSSAVGTDKIQELIEQITTRRRYTNARVSMPFHC